MFTIVISHCRCSQFNGSVLTERFGGSQSFGLVAQEVQQVMPELVTEDQQGSKAVRYNKLPLLLLQAVKELKAENETLKEKLASQEARLRRMEAKLGQ